MTVLEMYAGKRLWETGVEAKEHFDEYPAKCAYKISDNLELLLRYCLIEQPDGFSSIEKELTKIFSDAADRNYKRKTPDSNVRSADNLNNYALSMIELGKPELAPVLWKSAINIQPDHIRSITNRVFFEWRQGVIDDETAWNRLLLLPDCNGKTESLRFFREELDGLEEICVLDGAHDALDIDFSSHHDSSPENIKAKKCYIHHYFDQDGTIWLAEGDCVSNYDGKTGKKLSCYPIPCDIMYFDPLGEYAYFCYSHRFDSAAGRYYLGIQNSEPYKIYRMDRSKGNMLEDLSLIEPTIEESYRQFGAQRVKKRAISLWIEDNISLCLTVDGDYYDDYAVLKGKDAEVSFRKCVTERYELKQRTAGVWISTENKKGEKDTRILEEEYPSEKRLVWYGSDLALCKKRNDHSETIYRLSRLADYDDLAEKKTKADAIADAFHQAVKADDYALAIQKFSQYRELPGKNDAAETIKMEKTLSKVCRRVQIHHVAVAKDVAFIPEESIYLLTNYAGGEDPTVPPEVKKAIEAAADSLPITIKYRKRYQHSDTEKVEKWGVKKKGCTMIYLRRDNKVAFILPNISFDNGITGFIRLNIQKREMIPASFSTHGTFALSQNGKTIVTGDNYGEFRIKQVNQDKEDLDFHLLYGETIRIEARKKGFMNHFIIDCFTPDSRFVYDRSGFLISLGEDIREYSLPKEIWDKSVRFSHDGFFLTILDGAEKYYRLSYDYKFPGFTDWDEEAEEFAECFVAEHSQWTDEEFKTFMEELSDRGLGFLRKEGVQRKLLEIKETADKEPVFKEPESTRKKTVFSKLFRRY